MEKLIFTDKLSGYTKLSEDCFQDILRLSKMRYAKENDKIVHEKESLLFLISGICRIYTNTDDNKEVTQYFARTEEVVIPNILSTYHKNENVEAITDLAYVFIKEEDLLYLMTKYAEITLFYGAHLNERALRRKERNQRFLRQEPIQSYTSFMETYPGLELEVPTSHLANFLGLSTSEFVQARQKYKDRSKM